MPTGAKVLFDRIEEMAAGSSAASLALRIRLRGGASSPYRSCPVLSESMYLAIAASPSSMLHCDAHAARFKSTNAPAPLPKPSAAGEEGSRSSFVQWDGLANGRIPKLTRIRSFPVIGSMLFPWATGMPAVNPLTKSYDFWMQMHQRFGEFYSFGDLIGGRDDDWYRIGYFVNDPREFAKVIRAGGGKYPSGTLEMLWVNQRWGETRGMHIWSGLHGRGEEWRRIRRFLQTDLLHPESANGYVPGIARAASLASRGAQAAAVLQSSRQDDEAINSYLSRCAVSCVQFECSRYALHCADTMHLCVV